jgi:CBS domain-containing protein
MRAVDLISDTVPVVNPSDSGAYALRLMDDCRLRHLPVVDDRVLLGLISEEEILNTQGMEEPVGLLKAAMQRPFVRDSEHAFEVIKLAAQFRLSVIPVIDQNDLYAGAINRDELLDFLASETDILEPGAVIVLDISLNDYSLSEVARILESANTKILASFTRTRAETSKIELTVKINQTQLEPVIAALNRYNYEVKETFVEPEFFHYLKDRYDALMNYLNI